MFLFMGVGLTGFLVMYTLVTEIIPPSYVPLVTATYMAVDDLINGIFPSVYFLWVSKDWRFFYYALIVIMNVP